MADQELVITLRWAAEAAEQMANQYFQRRRQNIREMAQEEDRADKKAQKLLEARAKDFFNFQKEADNASKQRHKREEDRLKTRMALTKQMMKEIAAAEKDAERHAATAAKNTARERVAAARQAQRQIDAEMRRAAREQSDYEKAMARADADRLKTRMALTKQMMREQAESDKRAAEAKIEAERRLNEARSALRNVKFRSDAQARLGEATMAAREEVRVATEATEELKNIARQYQEYKAAGDKRGMESAKHWHNQTSRAAREALDRSVRYTKDAEREMGNALKHRSEEDRAQIRRENNERIDGVKRSTKAAREGYTEVARAAGRSMNDVAGSTGKATESLKDHNKALYTTGQLYFTLHAASRFGQTFEMVWRAVSESTKETDDYVRKLVEDMKSLRNTMGEILAMRGMRRSAMATAEIAKEAMGASVTTPEYVAFETKLTEDIANVTEPPELAKITEKDMARMGGAEEAAVRAQKAKYPIGAEQRKQLEKWAIPYVKSQGMTMEAGAAIFATTLAASRRGKDGRVSDAEFKDEFARNVETLQLQRGKASQTALQFDRVVQTLMAGGATTHQIAALRKQFSAMSQKSPQKAAMFLENYFRGLDEIINDEKKRDELGLGENVGYAETNAAVIAFLEKEQKRTPNVPSGAILRRMIADKRAAEGFAAQYDIGIKGGGFARQEAMERKINARTADRKAKEYLESPEAASARAEAMKDVETARAAAPHERFTAFETEIQAKVIGAGELETYETRWEAVKSLAGKGKSFESREKLFYYQETGRELQRLLLAHEDDDAVAAFLDRTDDGARLMTDLSHPTPDRNLQEEAFNLVRDAQKRRSARGGKPMAGAGAILRRARKEAERRVDSMSAKVGGEDIQGSRDYLVTRQTTEILKGQLGANPPARGRMSDDDYIQHLAAAIADPNLRAMMEAGNSPEARARAERVQAGMHGIPPAEKSSRVANVVMAPGTPPTIFETEKEAMMAHLRNPKDFPIGGGAGAADQAMSLEGPFAGAGIHRMLAAAVRPDAIRNARRHGMEKADPRKAGTWYTDERGHLRHTRRMSAVPLEDAGSMPVTWNVKPNAPSVHRSAAEAATSGDGGIHAAARELHAAARQMRRHVPSALPARPHVHR